MTYKEPLVQFSASLTTAEKKALEAAARNAGVSRSTYVRNVLTNHIARHVQPQQAAA